jgi:hypothetical protein
LGVLAERIGDGGRTGVKDIVILKVLMSYLFFRDLKA